MSAQLLEYIEFIFKFLGYLPIFETRAFEMQRANAFCVCVASVCTLWWVMFLAVSFGNENNFAQKI